MGLGRGGGFTRQHRSSGGDRIHDIGLAITPADLPVRAHHFDDRHLLLTQVPGQAHPVGASALDPHPFHITEAAQPSQQAPIANCTRRKLGGSQHPTDSAQNRGNVNIEVGVNATGDSGAWFCDRGHVRPLARTSRAGTARRWSDSPGTGCLSLDPPLN